MTAKRFPDLRPVTEEPPARVVNQLYRNLEERVAEPGVWARIATYNKKSAATELVSDLRTGRRRIPGGRWDLVYGEIEEQPTGTTVPLHGVWARFLGPDDHDEPPATAETE